MKERPILFSAEMVRAILKGRKTQTRRVIKIQPTPIDTGWDLTKAIEKNPYGVPGDRLWVREAFVLERYEEMPDWVMQPLLPTDRPTAHFERDCEYDCEHWLVPHYLATDPTPDLVYEDASDVPACRWQPSIHMPRWASRILLEVVDVRVERVQEISVEDCIAEGIEKPLSPNKESYDYFAQYRFNKLWDSINAKRGYSWESNPWVWVVEFKVLERSGSPTAQG